jgi:ABC-2 type transport system permease protein
VLAFLPSAALGDGMRAALQDGAFPGWQLVVLLGWAAVATTLTTRTFKWE